MEPEAAPQFFAGQQVLSGLLIFHGKGWIVTNAVHYTLDAARDMKSRFFTLRWQVVGIIVLVVCVIGSTVALQHHRDAAFAARVRDAARTVDILRPIVAADARFRGVTVSQTTSPGVWLTGTVASTGDWDALHMLVERTPVPSQAHFAVALDTNLPDHH